MSEEKKVFEAKSPILIDGSFDHSDAGFSSGHEVIDLRALRRLAMRGLESWNADLVRTIHGYDAAVIWKGAHASSS